MLRPRTMLAAAVAVLIASDAASQPLAVYPAKGQSAARQQKDRDACNSWAVGQTGYDPALASPPPHHHGGLLKGALGGAAIGGLAGSLSGDAGEGAAIGGALGAAAGGVRQSNRNASADNQQAANLDHYNRAFAACLTGRGYSVR